ncbi:MAG: hypothetical protein ACXW6R_27060, partial [Candidatus Binatia bacterium]
VGKADAEGDSVPVAHNGCSCGIKKYYEYSEACNRSARNETDQGRWSTLVGWWKRNAPIPTV